MSVLGGFRSHPLLRGGHAQTLAGAFLPGLRRRLPARYREVKASEGDRLAVLDARPVQWVTGQPVVVMVHGLGGSATSNYMVRLAARLHAEGVRTVRMNLRGAGAGATIARGIYHAGRSQDVRAVAEWIMTDAPGSPIGLLGFSLGGNLVLNLAADAATEPLPALDCVVAASPPIDLAACAQHIGRGASRGYDRNFVRLLNRGVRRLHQLHPELGRPDLEGIRSLYEFDGRYTARRGGFPDAETYYARSSAGPRLQLIEIPGLIVHAEDDPFIPPEALRNAQVPAELEIELSQGGGHMGFISGHRNGLPHRWLDARLTAWFLERWRTALNSPLATPPGQGAEPARVRPRAEKGSQP